MGIELNVIGSLLLLTLFGGEETSHRMINQALEFLSSVSVGADVVTRTQVPGLEGSTIEIDRGTKYQISLSREQFSTYMRPPLAIRTPWRPTLRLSELTYDFRTARFRVRVLSPHWDVLGIAERLGTYFLEDRLNRTVRPLLPERMRKPGYSFGKDPNLQETARELAGFLVPVALVISDLARKKQLANTWIEARVQMPKSVSFVPERGTEVVVPGGIDLHFHLHTHGPLHPFRLESAGLAAGEEGITVRSGENEFVRGLASLRLISVTLNGSRKVEYQYGLWQEDLINGIQGLLALPAVAAGRTPNLSLIRLNGIRESIDQELNRKATPKILKIADEVMRIYLRPAVERWRRGDTRGLMKILEGFENRRMK